MFKAIKRFFGIESKSKPFPREVPHWRIMMDIEQAKDNSNRVLKMQMACLKYEREYLEAFEEYRSRHLGSLVIGLFVPPLFNGGIILSCNDEFGRPIDWSAKKREIEERVHNLF